MSGCPSTHPTFNLGCLLDEGHLGDHAHDVGQLVYTWTNEKKENRMKWSKNLKVTEVRARVTNGLGEAITAEVVAEGGGVTMTFMMQALNVPNFGDVLTITVEGPDHG